MSNDPESKLFAIFPIRLQRSEVEILYLVVSPFLSVRNFCLPEIYEPMISSADGS